MIHHRSQNYYSLDYRYDCIRLSSWGFSFKTRLIDIPHLSYPLCGKQVTHRLAMASESAIKDHTAVERSRDLPPILSKKFNITDVKQDALKWNKEWEAAIASSTAADVLKEITSFLDDSFFPPSDIEFLHEDLRSVQDRVAEVLRRLFDEGHFDTIWLLLNVAEQRRHILEGLKGASVAPTLWGQDCRALCPELTVSNLLSQGGKGFIDFLTRVAEIFGSPITPAFLPNSWWEQASNLPNPWWGQASDVSPQRQISQSTKLVFEVATITRNQFIGECFPLMEHHASLTFNEQGSLFYRRRFQSCLTLPIVVRG